MHDKNDVTANLQKFPIPMYNPLNCGTESPKMRFCSEKRHKILTSPYDSNIFNGSKENNKAISEILYATQFHVCTGYCRTQGSSCRFGFPFPLQDKASISYRISANNSKRLFCLAPRSSPNFNATHPLLAVMSRSNTDVTIVIGKGVAESMYVCNYAFKVDKQQLFNSKALKKTC